MRILVVASHNQGDFAPFIIEQAQALEAVGCIIDFFGVEGKGIKGYLNNLSALKRKIMVFQPDVVHAHYGLTARISTIPVCYAFPRGRCDSRLGMCLSPARRLKLPTPKETTHCCLVVST